MQVCDERRAMNTVLKLSSLYAKCHERQVFKKVEVWEAALLLENRIKTITNSILVTCFIYTVVYIQGPVLCQKLFLVPTLLLVDMKAILMLFLHIYTSHLQHAALQVYHMWRLATQTSHFAAFDRRCDCDRQTLVTALDTRRRLEAERILLRTLISDLSMTPMLG